MQKIEQIVPREVPRGGHLDGGGGESTNEGVFVLSMEVVEIGCAMGSVLAGRVCP